MDTLKDKGAVVTGAASGIGKAIATAFIEAGASVLLCDLQRARRSTPPPASSGDRAIGRVTDVSDESQVEGAMRAARDAFGSLDIVVNCAGFGAIMPLTELTAEKWKAVQAVTLGGVFYGVKHGARQMLEQGRPGVIINISSVNGRQAGRGTGGLLCGQGRRGHDHALRRAGTRRSRHPGRRHRAGPGRDAVDAEGAGKSSHARALPGRHPDEAGGGSGRDCGGRRVSRVRQRQIDQR